MKGHVDEQLRALLVVDVSANADAGSHRVEVWIDTAFNGQFVFPKQLIAQLNLPQASTTEAILADGKRVELESYTCIVDWFGAQLVAEVIANDGRLPLLGTEMLADRRLLIEYADRRLSLD